MRIQTLVFALMLVSAICCAQRPPAPSKNFRLTPLPVVYYSPETRLGFGALVSANMNLGDSLTRMSYLQTSFIYTINKQYQLNNIGRIFTPGDNHILQYRLYFAYFPEYFFGYQTVDPESFREIIDYKRLIGEIRKYWLIVPHVYAGVFIRGSRLYDLHAPANGSMATLRPSGYPEYTAGGFAPVFNFDNRDNQVYPSRGIFVEAYWMHYPFGTGAINYDNFTLDARYYRSLNCLNDDVLALQLLVRVNAGTVPFRDMADIGGAYTMRGYYTGYYRFKNQYAFQLEYRFMVSRLIGFVGWAGACLVSEKWREPFNHALKLNGGTGIRVRLNQQDKLNVRADFGFGKKQSGLYFDVAEAF